MSLILPGALLSPVFARRSRAIKLALPTLAALPLLAMAFTHPGADDQALNSYFKAIRSNDLDTLRGLIRASEVKGRDADQDTPLFYAAADGSTESVQILLKAGANPNDVNALGATPLMWCAGVAAKVKALLAAGADPKLASKRGHTALEIAAYYDQPTDSMKLLIDNGADVNALDSGQATPLEVAAESNNLAGCKLLLNHGAKANSVDKTGGPKIRQARSIRLRPTGFTSPLLTSPSI